MTPVLWSCSAPCGNSRPNSRFLFPSNKGLNANSIGNNEVGQARIFPRVAESIEYLYPLYGLQGDPWNKPLNTRKFRRMACPLVLRSLEYHAESPVGLLFIIENVVS